MSKGKILYVEDYPVIQQLYVEVLGKHGFSVYAVSDGKQALEKVRAEHFDLILLDLLLPHVSGLEFLTTFHKEDSTTPIIVLTDFDKPETIAEVKKLGVTEYWLKVDYTPHVLAEKVEHFFATQENNPDEPVAST